ncbi:MAG: hypothetical protein ACFE75_10185 [Candidatus Hodarchaeota archaeon]
MIWDPLERLFWGIAITIAIMCGVYLINKGRRREIFNEKIIMYGLASLPVGFAFTLLFTFFQVLQVPGTFSNNIFIGDYEIVTPNYEIFGKLSYISIGIGGMLFVLPFDIIVKRTKYFLTIYFSIMIILIIISFTLDFARIVYNYFIILGIIFIVPIVLYLYTTWSRLEFKAVSSFLYFGFVLFMISLNLAKRGHKELNVYPLILSPIFLILGCLFTIFPTIVPPRVVSRPLLYWRFYAILTVPLLIIITTIDIIYGLRPFFVIEFIVSIVYISIFYYLVIKNINSQIISERQETGKELDHDVLAIFTRPQTITEEEVMFHKEQKICLVCKGNLLRAIYLCPECDALYCTKCSGILSNLENACWVCNTAFDPLKPVKPYKKEEEEIEPIVKEQIPKDSEN